MSKTVYSFEPVPAGDEIFRLAEAASKLGYSMKMEPDDQTRFRQEMKDFILDNGPTRAVGWGNLNEDVLPDNSTRAALISSIVYKLNLCAPTSTLDIVDPYLFPNNPDATYEDDLVDLIKPMLATCANIKIITLSNHNTSLASSVTTRLLALEPSLVLEWKFTNVFHDRFWIADGQRGIFIGASLNGIGKRYALLDFLQEQDAVDIFARIAALP